MSPTLIAMALGAAGALMLDPQQGRRRRALLRDKMVRGMREGREFSDAAAKDLRARAEGTAAQLRAWRGGPVTDDVLTARVRAKLGRCVSHPGAIHVAGREGIVTLTGDVLAAEHPSLIRTLRSVRGVRDLDDRLDVHTSAERVSSLQGGVAPASQRFELMQSSWSPGTRVMVGGAGALLVVYALARGGALGIAAIAGGAALLARAKANQPLREVMRAGREKVSQAAPELSERVASMTR
jgi:BON domain